MKSRRKQLINYLKSDQRPYKKLFEEHTDAIYIIDYYGKLVSWNKGCEELFGYNQTELNGLTADDLIYPEDADKINSFFVETRNGSPKRREFRVLHKEGIVKTITTDAIPIYSNESEVIGLFIIGKDITKERKMADLISQHDKRFRSLIQNSSEIITIVDSNHRVVYRSPSTEVVLGYKPEELSNKVFSITHLDDIEKCKKLYEEVFHYPDQTVKTEMRLKHKNGQWRDFLLIASNQMHDVNVNGIVVNYRDITDIKSAHREVRYMAYYDYLTNLPNRRNLEESFESSLEEAKYRKTKLAVMFIDIDRFKIINDTLGHATGDLVLKEVAAILKKCVSPQDLVARWAGDEFVILVPHLKDEKVVEQVVSKIKKSLKMPILINNYEVFATVSIGVSIFPDAGDDIQSLMKNADLAVYIAKKRGKNEFQIFSSGMNMETYKLFSLQNDLNNVIKNNQLELYYQPKVNVKTNEVVGAEALIRWNHPEWGIISPHEFIPFAEESGLIIPIGEWVIREVCKQISLWKNSPYEPVKIAINFSVLQFLQSDLIETISHILEETQVEGKWLEAEITESVILEREADIVAAVSALEEIGIQVALDDFGTGYSSLSYLTKYKFHTIKLDKSFLENIHKDQDSRNIIKFVTNLGKQLNMKIVAEGVEEEEQLHILHHLQCDEFQGYLFSKPQPVEEFEKLLKSKAGLYKN